MGNKNGSFEFQRVACFLASERWTKTAWSSQKLLVHLPEVGTLHKIRLNHRDFDFPC